MRLFLWYSLKRMIFLLPPRVGKAIVGSSPWVGSVGAVEGNGGCMHVLHM